MRLFFKNRLKGISDVYVIVSVLLIGSVNNVNAQLQGNYTIGGSGAKNFTSWAHFADSLNQNGVSGKVEVFVKADLTEKTVIRLKQHAKFPVNDKNPLMIKGGGYSLKGNQNKEILHLDGIDHLGVSNLIFENTHLMGRAAGIRFSNQADSNTIDSCMVLLGNIYVDKADTSAYVVFAVDTSMTKSTVTNNGSFNRVSHCVFKTKGGGGPRFAVIDQQGRSSYTTSPNRNIFTNNRIQNFYSGAFLLRNVNGEVIENNKIDRMDAKSTDAVDSSIVLFQLQGVRNGVLPTQIKGNLCENIPYSGTYTAANSELVRFTGIKLANANGNDSVYLLIQDNHFRNIRTKEEFNGITSTKNQCFTIKGNRWEQIYSDKRTSFGISANSSKDFEIVNNRFFNTVFSASSKDYVYFIYMNENSHSKGKRNLINDNVIDSNESFFMAGIWIYGACDYYIKRNQIINNKILSEDYSAFIGLQTLQVGNVDVVSNLIANNACKGQMLLWYSENYTSGYTYNAYYNTVSFVDSYSNYTYHYLSFFYDQSFMNFVGNVLMAKGVSSTSEVYMSLMERITLMEDNNFYLEGSFAQENWVVGNNYYSDFASWYQDVNVGTTNFFANPKFANPSKSDFKSGSIRNQNSTKASVFSDFDVYNEKRSANFHDLGAIESYFDVELKILNIKLPDTVCSGYELNPKCRVINRFWDTVTSFELAYWANGVWTKERFNKTIPPGDSIGVSFANAVPLSSVGVSPVAICLSSSNDNLLNDTVHYQSIVKPAPGGSVLIPIVPLSGNTPKYGSGSPLDKTIRLLEIAYTVSPPRNRSNAGYGKTWSASAQAFNSSGSPVSGASIVAPTSSDSLKWLFVTNDSKLDDSTLIWQLKISDLINSCDTVYSKNLYISPSPKLDFTVNQSLCNGDTLRFGNSTSVASNQVFLYYKWSFGTTKAGDTSDLFEPQFVYDSSGNYKVELEVLSKPDDFRFTLDKLLDIKARPKVAFDRDNACDGLPVNFTNKTLPAAAKMTWNFGKSDTVISKTSFQHRFLGSGSYWVTLKAEMGACSQSESIKIVVYEQPKAKFEWTSGSCQYDKFVFTNKTAMNTSLFGSVWNFDELDNRSTDKSATFSYQTSGMKRVRLRIKSEFGCIDSTEKTIEVKAAPVATIGVMDTCNLRMGKIFNATPFVAGVATTHSWELDGKAKGGADTLKEAWSGTGNFVIRLRVNFDNGCFDETLRNITVLRELKPDFTFGGACSGDTVYFKNTTNYETGDDIVWYWDFADGTVSRAFEQNHAFISDKTKTFNVMLRSTLNGACESQIVKPVTIWEKPRTCEFIGEPDYERAYYALKFEPAADGVRGGQNNVSYQWFLKGYTERNTSGTDASVSYTLSEDGEYEMRMLATTDDYGCSCTAKEVIKLDRLKNESLTARLRVYPNPSSGKFILSSADAGVFDVRVYGLNGSILWQKSGLEDGDIMDFSHFSEGNYILRLSDESGNIANRKLTIAR